MSDKKLKKGLTYISERTGQIRYSDRDQNERWLQPLGSYIPLEEIKRGQAVSVANSQDFSRLEVGNLAKDDQTYIVKTNPAVHDHCIGIAMEYSAGSKDGSVAPIHILNSGKFEYDPCYLIKSHQVEQTGNLALDEIKKTEYIPDFLGDFEKSIGKTIWVSNTEPGTFTIVPEEAYLGYRNIIQVGFVTDAWIKRDGSSVDEQILSNPAAIEVQVDGDGRGALDSTQFEGKLGEDVVIPSEDPIRVFALGQEDDAKFKSILNVTPNSALALDLSKAFIGFQKMDGKTAILGMSSDFSLSNVAAKGSIEDRSFIALAYSYISALNKNLPEEERVEIVVDHIEYPTEIEPTNTAKLVKDLIEKLPPLYKEVSGIDLTIKQIAEKQPFTGTPLVLEAEEAGGYNYIYISEELSKAFVDSYTVSNGSSNNRGRVVLADARIEKRQNLIGVFNSNIFDTLLKKSTTAEITADKYIFLHDGLFLFQNHPYSGENGENIGKEFYLGNNGRIVPRINEAYDTVTRVLEVQDKDRLLVHCGDSRVRYNGDELPIGYMKPAINCSGNWITERGFLLMDGSRVLYDEHKKLYARLSSWFKESDLNRALGDSDKGEDPEQVYFTIPKITKATENDFATIMQIKSGDEGVYETREEVPFIRKFGKFPKVGKKGKVTIGGREKPEGMPFCTVDKYHIDEEFDHIDEDNRVDITGLNCDALFLNKADLPDLEQYELTLYVKLPSKEGEENILPNWLAIAPGFHTYNNTTTYGFNWRFDWDKDEVNSLKPRGDLKLATDISDGIGICYTSPINGAPISAAGLDYKIVVRRNVTFKRQFDLDGVFHQYLKNKVSDPTTGEAYNNFAVTGAAVIDAIENRYHVKRLHLYSDKKKQENKESFNYELIAGTPEEPTTKVSISAVEPVSIHSKDSVQLSVLNKGTEIKKGETVPSVKISTKVFPVEGISKSYMTKAEYMTGSYLNESGELVQTTLPPLNLMEDNDLITKKQVNDDHNNVDAIQRSMAYSEWYKENGEGKNCPHDLLPIHGLKFGKNGNVDASTIAGYKPSEGRNLSQLKFDQVESYIPVTVLADSITGTDLVDPTKVYVQYKEGFTVNHKPGTTTHKYFSRSTYREQTDSDNNPNGALENIEFVDSNYDSLYNISARNEIDQNSNIWKYIAVKYNLKNNDNPVTSNESSFADSSMAYDVELLRKTSTTEKWTPASLKVGAIGVTSKLEYKRVYGEVVNNVLNGANSTINDNLLNYTSNTNALGKERPKQSEDGTEQDNAPYKDYMGSALQALYEMPLALWQYKTDNDWYKKYLGIVIERVNEVRDNIDTEDSRKIHENDKLVHNGDNTYKYTQDEVDSIKNYCNLITDNAESAQNIISSVGMLLKAAKETQERMLQLELSTFGADAPTIPGDRKPIVLDNLPKVVPAPTHLGLNRLVRAMAQELYGTDNPLEDLNFNDDSNNTQTSLSRLDELESEIEGKTFDETVETDSADNALKTNSSTYPYVTDLVTSKNIEGATSENSDNKDIHDPISGRFIENPGTDPDENQDHHGVWTKVALKNEQQFDIGNEGNFTTGTASNLVPDSARNEFNGTIDAITRICNKVNTLTYTINGVDNINASPRRLNTIRSNIELLIKEAFFDGEPETSLQDGKYITEDATTKEAIAYKDDNLDTADGVLKQPSVPYAAKFGKHSNVSRFDKLSDALYNYVIDGFDEGRLVVNNLNENDDKSKQYTSIGDRDKGADQVQVLTGRKFNGKNLLVSKALTDEWKDPEVDEFNSSQADKLNIKQVRINVPDSIEEYKYASIVDLLIDLIGNNFRPLLINAENTAESPQFIKDNRECETILKRLNNLEKALDNVVLRFRDADNKLDFFEEINSDSQNSFTRPHEDVISIESYMAIVNKWLGLDKVNSATESTWGTTPYSSAERAIAAGDSENATEPDKYLNSKKPIVDSNFVIKQIVLRMREEEHFTSKIQTLLKDEYLKGAFTESVDKDEDTDRPTYTYEINYTIWDDIKDLLLTVYGQDTDENGKPYTTLTHRTQVKNPDLKATHAWKVASQLEGQSVSSVFTEKETPTSGDKVYTDPLLTKELGIITAVSGLTITVNKGDYTFTRDPSADYVSSSDNYNTRFTGDTKVRNIIDDIIHEMYYTPSIKSYGDSDYTEVQDSTKVNDSDFVFYDFDNDGHKHYDFEMANGLGCRSGKALGYNNRDELFNDFKAGGSPLRRSRINAIEDEIKHLRALLGLNKVVEEDNQGKTAANTAYGGVFNETLPGQLGGHTFSTGANRTWSHFTSENGNATKSSLLTMLFNLESAFIDLNKELGVENTKHGKAEGIFTDESSRERTHTIYERITRLEDLTDTLLGMDDDLDDDESEEDTAGILDIKWF